MNYSFTETNYQKVRRMARDRKITSWIMVGVAVTIAVLVFVLMVKFAGGRPTFS